MIAPPPLFNPSKVDPEKEYDVIVTKPVSFGAAQLLPRHSHRMTGAFLVLIVKEVGVSAIYTAAVRG